jgi:hypothetical protein
VQLVLIAFVLAAPDLPRALARDLPMLWWFASGLAIVATIDYLRTGNRFAAEHHANRQRTTDND